MYYFGVFWFFLEGFILIFDGFIDMISIYLILGLNIVIIDNFFLYFLILGTGLIIIGLVIGRIAIREELFTSVIWIIHAFFAIPISIILCLYFPYTITSWDYHY